MRPLRPADLNPAILNVQYAVRGELAIKADELNERLRSQEPQDKLPFKKVISSNIGNPQQKGLDQPPITFTRQVCTIISLPFCLLGGGDCGGVTNGWAMDEHSLGTAHMHPLHVNFHRTPRALSASRHCNAG